MQHLIATLRQWLDLESPQEKYARRCYEAEQEEKRKREEKTLKVESESGK